MQGMTTIHFRGSERGSTRCLCVRILFWVIAGLVTAPLHAQISISLPLQGFYRPGQYMPVRVSVEHGPSTAECLQIEADAAIATRLPIVNGRASAVVPVFPFDTLHRLRWSLRDANGSELAGAEVDGALRRLGPEQRLVGSSSGDIDLARELFKDASIVPIRLDPLDPMPGPAASWQSLDVALLDSLPAQNKLEALLSGGVIIATRSASRPDNRWPWRQVGSLWVLDPALAGPRMGAADPVIFSPVQGWEGEWPLAVRRQI